MRSRLLVERERLSKELRILRSQSSDEFLANIFVIQAMHHCLGTIEEPYGEELHCLFLGSRRGWAAIHPHVHGDLAEIHLSGSMPSVCELRDQLHPVLGNVPWVVSITHRQGQTMADPDGILRPVPHLGEVLLRWARLGSSQTPSVERNLPIRLINSREHIGQVVDSGAYPCGLLQHLSSDRVQFWVGLAPRGDWVTRCHVERRDPDVWEVAGVETHPDVRRQGWGSAFLETLLPQIDARHILYLTHQRNRASRALAHRVGFVTVTEYEKYLYRR